MNAAFGCSCGSPSRHQQSGNSPVGLSFFDPALHTLNPSTTPMLQDDQYNHRTVRDVANLDTTDDDPTGVDLPSASPWNVGESAGPSSGWDLLEHCEPMGLEAHRREEDRRLVCPICLRTIRYRSHFNVHYRTHTGKKPYACDIFKQGFNTHSNMQRHRRTHTDERRFSCDICEQKYSTKSNLEIHRITHTGEKPHKCRICGKAFNRVSNCKIHIKTVHHKK